LAIVASSHPLNSSSTIPRHCRARQCTRTLKPGFFLLAQPLEEPDRSAFVRAASQAVEKLGANAYGPGALHRLLAPLWHQFFRPPSETNPTNRSRVYHPGDNAEARAVTKLARELPRQTEQISGGQV
jgi:hypothetical protein